MSLDEMKGVLQTMRACGVSSFKLDGMEVTFEPGAEVPRQTLGMEALPMDSAELSEDERKRLEDEILFHSAV